MKILLFSYKFHPDVGGIESISKMLAEYFIEAGHEVHLITKTKSSAQCKFPFKVIRNPGLAEIIKELKWGDIVFQNNPCFSISYPNFFIRKPSVISLQTWLESLSGKYDTRQKFKHALLRSASQVIACSNAIKTTFNDAIVIPNPYDEKLFKVKPGNQRTNDFIFLGRLVSDKGADIAIRAVGKLLKTHPSTNLTIVGNGEEIMALKELVNDLSLQWSVRFTGILEG
ncbi:MAG: glycosyltransferase family 4 protein, partial [Parafilimonas sp.]|nr:glycosyltransferase family 4 protein [Parafilimonas sp.]